MSPTHPFLKAYSPLLQNTVVVTTEMDLPKIRWLLSSRVRRQIQIYFTLLSVFLFIKRALPL